MPNVSYNLEIGARMLLVYSKFPLGTFIHCIMIKIILAYNQSA